MTDQLHPKHFAGPGVLFCVIVVLGQIWANGTAAQDTKILLLLILDFSWVAGVLISYDTTELVEHLFPTEDEQDK